MKRIAAIEVAPPPALRSSDGLLLMTTIALIDAVGDPFLDFDIAPCAPTLADFDSLRKLPRANLHIKPRSRKPRLRQDFGKPQKSVARTFDHPENYSLLMRACKPLLTAHPHILTARMDRNEITDRATNERGSRMAGFRKAKAEQAALKMGVYGPPGSGKTMTSLLIAEGLAKAFGKKVAYVDTEHGSDFYCKDVPTRGVHPTAFDFDALYSRSLTEIDKSIRSLDPKEYGVVVIDSITHLWEAARAAYDGRQTKVGTIPMQAWGKIKKPYKDLMSFLLSSPMHFIICGRQGVEYETDEETEELRAIGVKMKAEGETPYEPHILLRMEAIKPKKTNEVAKIIAYAEKDRTGVLSGRSFVNPTFESLVAPLLPLLGGEQAKIATGDEAAAVDAESLGAQERAREKKSAELLREHSAKIDLAADADALKTVGKGITKDVKAQMLPADVAALREKYSGREAQVAGIVTAPEAGASA